MKMNFNKIIYSIVFLAVTNFANAQVSIGGKQSVEGNSTVLDFNNTTTNTNGIILPAVISEPSIPAVGATESSPNNGTFIYDKATKKVKMYENNNWRDLSGTGDTTKLIVNNTDEKLSTDYGAVIGARTSSAKGVLVLESANKAMILPPINKPEANVKSPYPGMICYDTASKTLAVFDGTNWNYWK